MAGRGIPTRATVAMEVGLSQPLLALANNYVRALHYALFWLREDVQDPNESGVKQAHDGLYSKLWEEFNLFLIVRRVEIDTEWRM